MVRQLQDISSTMLIQLANGMKEVRQGGTMVGQWQGNWLQQSGITNMVNNCNSDGQYTTNELVNCTYARLNLLKHVRADP